MATEFEFMPPLRSRQAMPALPLDHPEPFAATLGVMLYPGDEQESRERSRGFASQYLATPLAKFHRDGGRLSYEDLARIHADSGVILDDLPTRWRDGLASGELLKMYFALANTEATLASWENAGRLVRAVAIEEDASASRALLNDVRSRYRSVAHLWAAFCIRDREIRSDPAVSYDGWHDFQFFLAEAEILLHWGRAWQPKRLKAQAPLAGDAWSVPEGWEPPERQPGWPMTGRVPHLTVPEEMLRDLRGPGRPRSRS